jgi:glycosyltransferase involved in cell wall biosynthesis
MRVDVLASRADRFGGADVYTSELVRRLADRGYDVTLYCHHADAAAHAACRVVTVDRGHFDKVPMLWRAAPVLQLWAVYRSMRTQASRRPDVVIGMAHQIIWAHRRIFGALPLLYLPHSMVAPLEMRSYETSSSIQRAMAVWLWHAIERGALNRAYRTLRFTTAGCEVLSSYYGKSVSPRYAVNRTPVEIPESVALLASGPFRMLSIGRLVPTKNNDFLLKSVARLRGDWTLDVVGEGPERAALESLARTLGVSDRVVFHGHVSSPQEFYAKAHLLVAPSRLENSPLVVVEAMAHGVPSLTIRSDGTRYLNANHELVDDEVNGFLAADEADFLRKLESLQAAPCRLVRAGAAARKTAIDRHSWRSHLDHYEQLIHDAAQR